MFSPVKAVVYRMFIVFYMFALTLLRLSCRLLGTLVGVWQPPSWLCNFGRRLFSIGQRLCARPKRTGVRLAVLALFTGISVFVWHWYQGLPVPHTVAYSVDTPDLTNYQQKPIGVDILRIEFNESAAPLGNIGKDVADGIHLQPEIPGIWHWVNDRRLIFTPSGDWAIDQGYKVNLERDGLLAKGTLLNQYKFEFRTPPFSASLVSHELYQDPVVPNLKKLVTTINFSHPVDEESFRQHASVSLAAGLEYRDKDILPTPEVNFNKTKLTAYLHSAPLATPLESSTVSLAVDKGVRARDGFHRYLQQSISPTSAPRI